jgi:hypothetical protein
MTENKNKISLEENSPAPTIYVDGFQGVSITNGVAKFNFFSAYVDPEGHDKRRIVLRLACAVGAIDALNVAFGNLLMELKQAGVVMPGTYEKQ